LGSGDLTINSSNVLIGDSLIGKISQTKIYNKALTPEEILQNYNANFYKYITNFKARVEFDGGTFEAKQCLKNIIEQ